jgi:hypothetical protein
MGTQNPNQPQTTPTPAPDHPVINETRSMNKVVELLEQLPEEARERVLTYVNSRFGKKRQTVDAKT